MNANSPYDFIAQDKPWPRPQLLAILQAGLSAKSYRFVRQTALAWLTYYEHDCAAQLLHAQALIGEGRAAQALPILDKICLANPEFLEAQELRAQTHSNSGSKGIDEARGCYLALGGSIPTREKLAHPAPTWVQPLRVAHHALTNGDYPAAEEHITEALAHENMPPLAGVTHLKILWGQPETPRQAVRNLAEHYHRRWPECIPVQLILADSMMGGGSADQAVALLHRAASGDPSGQASSRLWGENNPYQALWPKQMQAPLEISIPAQVAAALGWNLLPGGEIISPASRPPLNAKEPDLTALRTNKAPRLHSDNASLPPETRVFVQSGTHVEAHPTPKHEWQPQAKSEAPAIAVSPHPFHTKETEPSALRVDEGPQLRSDDTNPPVEARGTSKADLRVELEQARAAVREMLSEDSDHKAQDPETPIILKEKVARAAQRLNLAELAHADGRMPVYIIMSTRAGLRRKFGPETTQMLDAAMSELVLTLRERKGWGSLLIYPDDPAAMAGLGLKPTPTDDAWALKLALRDLDTALREKNAMIGTLLIVGGPEVVPFHHLPNPTDDADVDVPSDNPYATRDENYFIPEWPVGRLPGGHGRDPDLLLSSLRAMNAAHRAENEQSDGWFGWLLTILRRLLPRRKGSSSFGYSAEIWQRAAHSVFRAIGEPRAMLTSPPLGNSQPTPKPSAQLGYFNLHGLIDAPDWYGQRDPAPNAVGEHLYADYPIALRPKDVVNGGRAPQVVFSEACYGAHVFNRRVEGSLALKFLLSGSRAVIGSTAIAYGSITPPLNAADLLGKSFWGYLQEGYPAGEALRRAKIQLARQMHKRQGYLDGEDQKTLISFVLYGDPLAVVQYPKGARDLSSLTTPKDVLRFAEAPPQVKTICDRSATPGASEPIPKEVMIHIKQVVEQYLPGMEGAQLALSHEQAECCCEGHTCPTGQLRAKSHPAVNPRRSVVTMSKELRDAQHIHPSYARLTFDAEGKIVKLAVSR